MNLRIMPQCNLMCGYQHFGQIYCLYFQVLIWRLYEPHYHNSCHKAENHSTKVNRKQNHKSHAVLKRSVEQILIYVYSSLKIKLIELLGKS